MLPFLADIVDLMFPPECHVCGAPLAPHDRFVCPGCLSHLPRTGYHRRPLNPMEERFAGKFRFDRATGHFFYSRDSSLSVLIQDMKYRGFPGIGTLLGEVAASELFPTGFFNSVEAIVPVPMHFFKRARRGYNQTDHIAVGISKATGIPVVNALKAVKGHKTQTALSSEERLENLASVFEAVRGDEIEGRGVLVVDDVCTTGATLSAAATTLLKSHPSALSLFSLGVTF